MRALNSSAGKMLQKKLGNEGKEKNSKNKSGNIKA